MSAEKGSLELAIENKFPKLHLIFFKCLVRGWYENLDNANTFLYTLRSLKSMSKVE